MPRSRRDPFARLKQSSPTPSSTEGQEEEPSAAPRPIDLIPRPKKRTRRREWERAHPAQHYRVPAAYYERGKAVRAALVGLAQQYQTTADNVATALMRAALTAVQEGEIQLSTLPVPQGKKMAVEVVRTDAQHPIHLPKPKPKKKAKPLMLTYRWGKDLHQEIVNLAGDAPLGAVVVVLLEAALEWITSGKWSLRSRPVTVKQEVKVARSRKIEG